MNDRPQGKPLYVWVVRFLLIACMAALLWVGALVSPFVAAHILEIKGSAAKLGAVVPLAAAFLIAAAFLCYLMDRF